MNRLNRPKNYTFAPLFHPLNFPDIVGNWKKKLLMSRENWKKILMFKKLKDESSISMIFKMSDKSIFRLKIVIEKP